MFSVLVNRTQTAGFASTIDAFAVQSGQFFGYNSGPSGGRTKYNAALQSAGGTPLCDDLTDVVTAMNYVLGNGSQLGSRYLYWKAINQGKGRLHKHHPGDIYVANTAFGTVN